ncbi:hypothetical protein V2J09_009819 [Rumex salicifolius]
MGDHKQRGQAQDYKNILGIKEICKSYKNLVMKWGPRDKNSGKNKEDDDSPSTSRSFFHQSNYNREGRQSRDEHEGFFRRSSSSFLSRTGSRRSNTPTPTLQRSESRRSKSVTKRPTTPTLLTMMSQGSGGRSEPIKEFGRSMSKRSTSTSGREFGRTASKRSTTPSKEFDRTTSKRSTTPIVFSQSAAARRKPLPVEKELDCTLEELCFGAVKNITIKKDVITEAGIIVQEEETLKINVKPGWSKGTKITFEGKGDEKPGYLPADVIFLIREKRHSLFKRVDDDLELGVEVPLVKALTGCTVALPLLGGEKMTLRINDVIFPGFRKSIAGQGMPVLNQDGRRGELVLKFIVDFPKRLNDDQRSEIRAILDESFLNDE